MGLPNAGMSGFTHEGVTSGLTLNSGSPSASMNAMPEGGGVAVTKPAGRPMTSGEKESAINKRAAFGDDAAKDYKGELARNGVDTSFAGNSPASSGPDVMGTLRDGAKGVGGIISDAGKAVGQGASAVAGKAGSVVGNIFKNVGETIGTRGNPAPTSPNLDGYPR